MFQRRFTDAQKVFGILFEDKEKRKFEVKPKK